MNLATNICPNCGRELSPAARYCPGCGGKVSELEAVVRREVRAKPASSMVAPAVVPVTVPPELPKVQPPPLIHALSALRGDPRFGELDRWVEQRIGLPAVRQRLTEPVILCETPEEFYGALLSGEALSAAQWQALLEAQLREAKAHADHGGGVWGAFLAGQSCLLNGWLFKEVHELARVRDVLQDPRTVALLWSTMAHEKWGHGFLSAMTALGTETRQVQLDRLRYARLFSGFQVTTPEGVILREKWRAVFQATRFAEEGWSTWVENLVRREYLPKAGGVRSPVPAAEWTASFSPQAAGFRQLISAQQALGVLFDAQRSPDEARAAMATLERAEEQLTPYFVAQYGRPPRYVIGYGLCWMIEKRFGAANVPPGMILANNVVYGLAAHGVSDIANVIASSHDMNVNRRLTAIAHLPRPDAPDLTRAEFARACHDLLGFNLPDDLLT